MPTPEQQMAAEGGPAMGYGLDGVRTGMVNGQIVNQIVKMNVPGMSLRKWYASLAMHAFLLKGDFGPDGCRGAFEIADGMLVEGMPDAPEADESPNGQGGPTNRLIQ